MSRQGCHRRHSPPAYVCDRVGDLGKGVPAVTGECVHGDERPSISVVTVALNAVDTIEQTIASVHAQSYPNVEHVVVDGGSSDGTLRIVDCWRSRIHKLISGPDEGIADAMNKGLAEATGDYVLFLHADDYLVDNAALSRAASRMAASPVYDIHAFPLYRLSGSETKLMHPRGFTARMNFKTGILHQAAFCRRALFDELGGFDPTLCIAMDYEFFLRAYRAECSLQLHDEVVSVMRDTGVSSRVDAAALTARFAEERTVQRRYCRSRGLSWFYRFYWPLYLRYRGLRGFGRADALLTGR